MFSRADRRVVENQTQRLFAEQRRAAVALETARVSEITKEESGLKAAIVKLASRRQKTTELT